MIVDIHNHILPHVDDGAKDIDEAILMAKQAEDNGIFYVIATPHHHNGLYFSEPEFIIQQTNELNSVLIQNDIQLKILPGMEIHLYGDLERDLLERSLRVLPLANSMKYLLVELPYSYVPHYTESILYKLQVKGYIPIIAHPERNAEIKRHPNRLYEFIRKGALAQVTAGSVTGDFGLELQKLTLKLIKHNLVHFIASDAHNTTNRSFQLLSAYKEIEQHFSYNHVECFIENAVHVLDGTEFNTGEPKKLERRNKVFSFFSLNQYSS